MNLLSCATADQVAEQAAAHIAGLLREAVEERGTATLAVSGGSTPRAMLGQLALQDVPWASVTVFQVDERVVPDGDERRNLSMVMDAFVDMLRAQEIEPPHIAAMSVGAGDVEAALADYRKLLGGIDALDVVQLGLGSDGHTASLVPDDPILGVTDDVVAATDVYQGTVRISLTAPAIIAARARVWIVTGAAKCGAVVKLVIADADIPATLVRHDDDVVFLDEEAAELL